MTIDEAIEIKTSDRYGTVWPTPPKEVEADRLSTEALKRIQYARLHRFTETISPLQGETKD